MMNKFCLEISSLAFAAVCSKETVMWLLMYCLLLLPLFVEFCVLSLFSNAVLSVLSSFAIILLMKRELTAIL